MKKNCYILLMLSVMIACGHQRISEKLEKADSLLVAENYDSAYIILSGMKEASVTKPNDKALYSLLLTQICYHNRQDEVADSLLDGAIDYYKQHQDNYRLADGYYHKSSQQILRGNYSQAITYAKKAEQLAEGTAQQYKIAERLCYLNEKCANFTLQLEYARKSLRLASLSQNKNWMAYAFNNLGAAWSNLDKFDSAHHYFEKIVPYIKYVDDRNKPAFLSNIGLRYKDDDPEKAKQYFVEALKYKETSSAYENLADVYYMQGQHEKAYSIWKKALTINDGDYKDNIIHSILSYDLEHGRIETACDNLDEIVYLKDSMLNKLKNDTIKDLQLRFDHEVAMLEQEKITSNWKIGVLIFAVLVLLVIVYTVWKHSKMKEKMHEVQMQINDYVSQIKELKASNGDVSEAINELNRKIKKKLEEMSPELLRGQMLYEQIEEGKIDSIYNWTEKDEKLFVEFYKTIDYRTVHELISVKRTNKITTHRLFYLLLRKMGKTDKQIQSLFSISDSGIKMLRNRTKEAK